MASFLPDATKTQNRVGFLQGADTLIELVAAYSGKLIFLLPHASNLILLTVT